MPHNTSLFSSPPRRSMSATMSPSDTPAPSSPSRSPSETSSMSTTSDTSSFNIMHLPSEIRTKIYLHALTRDQAFLWPTPSDTPPHSLSPALLSTCSQIAAEATPLLYKHNRFSFKHPSDCNVFAHIMSRQHVQMIPKVGFHVREKDVPLFINYFASTDPIRSLAYDLPNLQYLIVFLSLTSWPGYRDPDDAVRKWMQSQALRKICMSLEGRSRAEVTVLCSVRIAEQLFGYLRRGHVPETLGLVSPGHMRTKVVEVAGCRVMLEIFCVGMVGFEVVEAGTGV